MPNPMAKHADHDGSDGITTNNAQFCCAPFNVNKKSVEELPFAGLDFNLLKQRQAIAAIAVDLIFASFDAGGNTTILFAHVAVSASQGDTVVKVWGATNSMGWWEQ